jgi:hypothetical protein
MLYYRLKGPRIEIQQAFLSRHRMRHPVSFGRSISQIQRVPPLLLQAGAPLETSRPRSKLNRTLPKRHRPLTIHQQEQ